jgi:hypothetical protein
LLPPVLPMLENDTMKKIGALVIACWMLTGCDGCGSEEQLDAATPDSAAHDAALVDGARPDAVHRDAARPDTAQPDTAPSDAAHADSAAPDATRADAAVAPDAAHEDAAVAEDSAVAEDGAVAEDSAVPEDSAVLDNGPPYTTYTEFGGQPYIRAQTSGTQVDATRWCECQGKTLRDATVWFQGGCDTYTGKWEYPGSCGGHVWDCCDGCWDTVTCWD